jgi:hypothetical protein
LFEWFSWFRGHAISGLNLKIFLGRVFLGSVPSRILNPSRHQSLSAAMACRTSAAAFRSVSIQIVHESPEREIHPGVELKANTEDGVDFATRTRKEATHAQPLLVLSFANYLKITCNS